MYELENVAEDPITKRRMDLKVKYWLNLIVGLLTEMYLTVKRPVLKKVDQGKLHMVWSGWEGYENGQRNIYIATM